LRFLTYIRDFRKIGRRYIKQPKECLIQSYHVCKDTNHLIQEDVCDYFNHKLTFFPNKQLTEIKIYLSLGRRFKSQFQFACFQVVFKTSSDVAFTRVITLDNSLVKTAKTVGFKKVNISN